MKKSMRERKMEKNFRAGGISRSGFFGSDTRHIHDIILEDERVLCRLGIDCEFIAEKLQDFIEEGKQGLETWVLKGAYEVQVRWQRGMLPCPFGESGLHHTHRRHF